MKILAFILLQFSTIQNQVLNELKAFQSEDGVKHGVVAASIRKLSDNKSVLSFNESKAINSASTLKLITTATALSKLGSQFRYTTEVYYSGSISNETIIGNLIIQGNGDPSFGSERGINPLLSVLNEIGSTLEAMKITKIKGNIIINDETAFDNDVPDSWIWGDIGNYYGAIPHKLNINENLYTIYFDPGNSIGEEAKLNSLQPFDPDWKIINLVKTGAINSGDQVYIYGNPDSETLVLKGTVPLGKSNFLVKGAIPNPAKLFRVQLMETLEKIGIEVEQKALIPMAKDLPSASQQVHLIKRFESQPLSDLARDCNFSSINIYADAFLHTLALRESGFQNFKESLETLKSFWKTKIPDLGGFNPKDGSGLSPSGFITTKNMTDILAEMAKSPVFSEFESTIPVVGQDGSLRYKDSRNATNGRVKAKSGSIESTRAYAGYFEDKAGEKYAFMVAVNRYEPELSNEVRSFLDNFLIRIGSR